MDDQKLSIPICHSPGGSRGSRDGRASSPREKNKTFKGREPSFSTPAMATMDRADYWDDLGVKTGIEMAFGLPDPEGGWEEVLEEERPEEWSSVCLHFTQNTTFHGINKITESTPFGIRRVIWVLIVLGGLTLFLTQMVRSVLLYLEYPVTVNTKIIYNKTVSFPAVTICNQNVFRISRAASYGHYLLIDELYSSSLQQMNLTDISTSCPDAPSTTLKTLLDDTAHDKHDMIATCMWDGKPCSADDFVTSITDHGVCFTFNSGNNVSIKTASRTGSEGGLRLKLNIEQYEYMQGPNSAAGVKILPHDPTETPLVRDFGQAVSPGSHAFVGIQMTQINNLMKPHGECQAEKSLEFFTDYNIPNCQVDCLANYLRSKCNCRMVHMPEFFDYPGEPPYCTFGEWEACVTPALRVFEVVQKGPSKCDCPVPCTRRKYETTISYGTMSNFDTEKQGRNSKNDYIRQSFIKARETTQRVDNYVAAADYEMVQDLGRAASSIGGIFDQISDKMQNISHFVENVFYELSNRTFFHQKYGLEKVQKALQYGFIQAWDIDQQHVFVPLLSGAKQLLIRYRKAMVILMNDSHSSPAFRKMVAWTQEEVLSTRLDMALRTRENFQRTYYHILDGIPLLQYDWAIHRRYGASLVPRGLLRHNVPYLTSMYEYLVTQLNVTIDITRELKHMVRQVYHKHEWNETLFHELRKAYIEFGASLTYAHNTFKTAVFGNMNILINKQISEFTKLEETMRRERKDIGITIQNFNQLVSTMKEDVWPAIMQTVNLSLRYSIDTMLNKTSLAQVVTSPEINARLKQMADIFIDVRARARNLDHDWRKFRDAQIAVWSSIKRENTTRTFYTQLNTDFRTFILPDPNASISHDMLRPFRKKLGDADPETLYRWTNADVAEKDERKHEAWIQERFDVFMNQLGILSGVNEKDDKFFDVFNMWMQSLKTFVADCQINDKFFKENFMEIDVYMTELYYQFVEQREAYDLTSLWSDIGGSMGLFVGASVITVFELIDAMLHNFLKVQLQETKQRRRSMAVMRSQSMKQSNRDNSSKGGKPQENSNSNSNHIAKRQAV